MKKNKTNRYLILDLQNHELAAEESELLKHPNVAGVILFTRNYHNKKQLQALIQSIKKQSPNMIIAVDQEGGRVQRFREEFTTMPPMAHWGKQYELNPKEVEHSLSLSIQLLCKELSEVGVNLNLIPVLDIDHGINEMIGERSLHHDPLMVIKLATIIIRNLKLSKMPAVGKHFPGHGGVVADSHHTMTKDHRSWEEIEAIDLQPFKALAKNLDFIMPAHIIFEQCDELPVTYSSFWLQQILREQLNFPGIIISDDLTMAGAAGVGDYSERTYHALKAGIDLILICNHRAGAISALENMERLPFNPLQSERLVNFRKNYFIPE